MSEWQFLEAPNGIRVPVQEFKSGGSNPYVFLMLPALGVQARFYQRLARQLAEGGLTTYLLEQRGHGESPYRAKRGVTFGYSEFLEIDIPEALKAIKKQHPQKRILLGGHSLGGHLSSVYSGKNGTEIAGVIHLACGFPYHGLYKGRTKRQIRFLCAVMPLMFLIYGYFPGDKLGFGGRDYKSLMMDWRRWALKGDYDFGTYKGVDERIATYEGQVLSIAFEKDYFISDAAVEFSRSRFQKGTVKTVTLGEAAQGKFLGHFDWAKAPSGVVQSILEWVEKL